MFNVDPSSRSTSFFILVITVLIKNVRWFLLKIIWKNSLEFFKGCLIVQFVKDLFLWSASLCVRSFIILSQFFFVCQELFLIYFVIPSCSALQQLLYNIILILSVKKFFDDIYYVLFWSFSVSNFYRLSHLITCVKKFFLFFSEARSAPMLYFPAALSATLIILP